MSALNMLVIVVLPVLLLGIMGYIQYRKLKAKKQSPPKKSEWAG